MIYLIQSMSVDIDKHRLKNLLKVGFTEDDSSKTRFSAYKLHNPLCKILYTIPEGTREHESKLHHKFKEFIFDDYGREWFNYDDSIINFFKNNKTKEDLDNSLKRESVKSLKDREFPSLYNFIKKVVNRWLNKTNGTIDDYKKYKEELVSQVRKSIFCNEDVLDYLQNTYNVSDELIEDIEKFVERDGNYDSDKITEFFTNFNNYNSFYYRMKLVCEFNLTKEERDIILDEIPISFSFYYKILGPDRCKALSYNLTLIKKEYKDKLIDKNKLKNSILSLFCINEKYTSSSAKETLAKLYSDLGYNKTAKATDLEEFFEVKNIQVIENGKKSRGIKLLSLKND